MKIGDIVRLKYKFKPSASSYHEYSFGMIAGVSRINKQNSDQTEAIEFIVYLYDPKSSTIYLDEFGMEGMFSFRSDEISL